MFGILYSVVIFFYICSELVVFNWSKGQTGESNKGTVNLNQNLNKK